MGGMLRGILHEDSLQEFFMRIHHRNSSWLYFNSRGCTTSFQDDGLSGLRRK
jgi:hypothetical protein